MSDNSLQKNHNNSLITNIVSEITQKYYNIHKQNQID